MAEVCLPAWLVAVLVLSAGSRGVLRDLVEHHPSLGGNRLSDEASGSSAASEEK